MRPPPNPHSLPLTTDEVFQLRTTLAHFGVISDDIPEETLVERVIPFELLRRVFMDDAVKIEHQGLGPDFRLTCDGHFLEVRCDVEDDKVIVPFVKRFGP